MTFKTLGIYTIWNIVRYITIGVLVYFANQKNIQETDGYKQYCCDCYYVSLDPHLYSNIAQDIRFDLSFCIPSCTDCNWCKTRFHNNAQSAFDYNGEYCPVTGYNDRHSSSTVEWNWNALTGCTDNTPITTLVFLVKSYQSYGVMGIALTVSYSIALLAVLIVSLGMPIVYMLIFRWILIYNVFVSEICLYLLFKPFQFYRKELFVGDKRKQIICEINSIRDVTAQILTFTIWISVLCMLAHVLYVLYRFVRYCKRYFVSYTHQNRNRQESVSLTSNQKITYGTHIGGTHKLRWGFCAVIVTLLMMFFLGIGMYAMTHMIIVSYQGLDTWHVAWIVCTTLLLLLSICDNPWVFDKIRGLQCCGAQTAQSRRTMLTHSPLN
eukprot:8851_1